ncbi:MAG TPA: hypothetical protein VG347_16260 [Verrucomicrobiae bacterium]|nr:hypothetical protein [Verrucomicrobiae bacterium]
MKSKILTIMAVIIILTLIAAMVVPLLENSTNCGGNNPARTDCYNFSLYARMASEDNTEKFEIEKIDKQCLQMLARQHWGICGTDLLVRTNFLTGKINNHELVIVCTEPFGNIPKPTIWNFYHRHPAHAVGYSDGDVNLISPGEFRSLNLSGFTSISNLVASTDLVVIN